jgi:flagellar protein FliL
MDDIINTQEELLDGGGKKRSKMPLIIVAILVLGAAGAGFVFFGKKKQPKPEPPTVKAAMHLDTFTVNLSDPEQKAYLRVGIDLGLERDPKVSGEEPPVALVRDTILTILMSATPSDLATPDGKQKLKTQLLLAIRQRAPELKVHEVYFTEFLMQE